MSNKFICFNGNFYNSEMPVITANNRGFRYGDGFFETMKVLHGKLVLKELHFNRMFKSLQLLQFKVPEYFTASYMEELIISLLNENKIQESAKVRINIFRGNGSLGDIKNNELNFIIEAESLAAQSFLLNNKGLIIDVYKDAKKVCDNFSHLKTNNFLPYSMAALWASKNNLDDALLLNKFNNIADATIANIFIVKDGVIYTPALTEGCIDGVMRKYLLTCCNKEGIPLKEVSISISDVQEAQEIFLTNSVFGIKWVQQCGNSFYTLQIAKWLYNTFIADAIKA